MTRAAAVIDVNRLFRCGSAAESGDAQHGEQGQRAQCGGGGTGRSGDSQQADSGADGARFEHLRRDLPLGGQVRVRSRGHRGGGKYCGHHVFHLLTLHDAASSPPGMWIPSMGTETPWSGRELPYATGLGLASWKLLEGLPHLGLEVRILLDALGRVAAHFLIQRVQVAAAPQPQERLPDNGLPRASRPGCVLPGHLAEQGVELPLTAPHEHVFVQRQPPAQLAVVHTAARDVVLRLDPDALEFAPGHAGQGLRLIGVVPAILPGVADDEGVVATLGRGRPHVHQQGVQRFQERFVISQPAHITGIVRVGDLGAVRRVGDHQVRGPEQRREIGGGGVHPEVDLRACPGQSLLHLLVVGTGAQVAAGSPQAKAQGHVQTGATPQDGVHDALWPGLSHEPFVEFRAAVAPVSGVAALATLGKSQDAHASTAPAPWCG